MLIAVSEVSGCQAGPFPLILLTRQFPQAPTVHIAKAHEAMHPFSDLLVLSLWTLVVFAVPAYNPDQFNVLGSQNGLVYDSEIDTFRRNKKSRWKSVEKCDEYAEAAGQTVWIMPLSGFRPLPIFLDCSNLVNSLISGSEEAAVGEFPHMAALGWFLQDRTIGWYCGGSLISDRWILTAAHCTHGPLGKPKLARLGSNRLSDDQTGRSFRIGKIVRHPAYNPPSKYADLALLKLVDEVTFRQNVRPACLHVEFDRTPEKAWITGWGTTSLDDELSDVLVKAELEVIDNVSCSRLYNSSTSVPSGVVPSMICAGDSKGGWKKDTCRGDSGGPLQALHPFKPCLYEIIGVTSFGKDCGTSGLPGIYTRVSHYVEWVEDVVWPDQH